MRKCTLLLAGLAVARAQDPQIMTSNGNVVIQADDIEFSTSNQSVSVNGLVRSVMMGFSQATADRGVLSGDIATLSNTVAADRASVITQIAASASTLRTDISSALAVAQAAETAAAETKLPIVTTFAALVCDVANTGLMQYLHTAECKSVYVCMGASGLERAAFTGPPAGRAACNPAADCAEAVRDNNGAEGRYHIATDSASRLAFCEASGVEAGDGSVGSPGLSCESIYTHHPAEKARGRQVYKMLSPEGHGQFYGFTATRAATYNAPATCRGPSNATHSLAARLGNTRGSINQYNYLILPPGDTQTVRCINNVFGDPSPGRTKYCYCGMYARGLVDVQCSPTLDQRVSLTGLVGWWKAENYPLSQYPQHWPSTNPAALYGRGPNITSRHALVENPQGWARESRASADNNAHARYNAIAGLTNPDKNVQPDALPGLFPHRLGTKGTGVNFGALTDRYCICTTSRYYNSMMPRGRIFVASAGNWLHGHWNQRTNVVHYGRWAISNSRGDRYDWIVTCTTYQGARSQYIYGGTRYTSNSAGLNSGNNRDFGLGFAYYRTRENSGYAFGEVLIYNRQKSTAEIRNLSLYLTDRLRGLR